ncbi:hypothetical protein QM012_005713 [Aureobasidium pullulans]|uniref:Poly(A) RNA polymerase mitochondrial-like central palm domain-containing protein n=1 Tax=Aureobasidium pullulans TaxID=5580 RepID=A0ABR0TQI7_AURPU
MPCQSQLLRLRDSRQTLHHIFRHAVTYSPQQFRHEHSAARDSAQAEFARQKARLAALKRLNQHINPDDLSATLEAHREANRAAVIRKVTTERSDPDVVRPSILETQAPLKWIAKRRAKEFAKETQARASSTDISANLDTAAAYQLRLLEKTAQITKKEADNEWRRARNKEQYQRWVDFLTKREDPLAPIPEYKDDDRSAFFTTQRRVFAIIREEQIRRSATRYVEDLAPPNFLSHHGLAQPIVLGLRGYPRSEPWNRRPRSRRYTTRHWLETEIEAFAEWMEMTPSEEAARAELSKTLIDLVKQADPALVAEIFGSQLTGLTMPNSDVDIRIRDPSYKRAPYQGDPNDKAAKAAWAGQHMALRKQRMVSHLRVIQSLLAKHEDFTDVQINAAAYFPLVIAVHKHTGLKVQIVSTKFADGAQKTTKKYLAEFPQLKALFLLLKATLNLRNLSDPWFGGVGSYTLFMMCVAALKYADKRYQQRTATASVSLLHFLDFWSKFDTYREGLSIEPFARFRKVTNQSYGERQARKEDLSLWARHRIAIPSAYRPWMLHLQDPADLYNDLGRSALAIKDIQATFKQLYFDLTWELEDPKRREDSTALLRNFVGNSERYFDEMRTPVDLWGSQFVDEYTESKNEAEGEANDVDVDALEDVFEGDASLGVPR